MFCHWGLAPLSFGAQTLDCQSVGSAYAIVLPRLRERTWKRDNREFNQVGFSATFPIFNESPDCKPAVMGNQGSSITILILGFVHKFFARLMVWAVGCGVTG
jgi:hypothetical protein